MIGNCQDCEDIAPLYPVKGHRSGMVYYLCNNCAAFPSELYYDPSPWPRLAAIWVVVAVIWGLLAAIVIFGGADVYFS